MCSWHQVHTERFQHYSKIYKSNEFIKITDRIEIEIFLCMFYLVIIVKRGSLSNAKNECDKNCAPNHGKAKSGGVSLSLCIWNRKFMKFIRIALINHKIYVLMAVVELWHWPRNAPDAIVIQRLQRQKELQKWEALANHLEVYSRQ